MKNLLLMALSLGLTACGVSTTVQNKKPPFYNGPLGNSIVALEKDEKACQEFAFTAQTWNVDLNLFLEGGPQTESYNFTNMLDGQFVRNPKKDVIKSTVYGLEFENVYDYGAVTQWPKELTICPGEMDYKKNSIESAALNTAYFVNLTNQKVQALRPQASIEAITLNIAPKIKKKEDGVIKFFVNNASYDPNMKQIFMFPHTPEYKLYNRKNFWEIPMVPAHEYGHHIFNSFYAGSASTTRQVSTCFAEVAETSNGVSKDRVLDGLNEGFADMVAFYSLSAKESSFQNVGCFQKSREVDSPVFYDQQLKLFTATSVDGFFSLNPTKYDICELTNFGSIHTLGAIFAHTTHRFLGNLTFTNEKKLDLVLSWLELMNTRRVAMKALNSRDYLKMSVKLMMVNSVTKLGGQWTSALCAEAQTIYPGIEIEDCSL